VSRRSRRRDRAWGRYVNRYEHVKDVAAGGRALRRIVLSGICGGWIPHHGYLFTRRQSKRKAT
jgi:hypothetical protein